MNNSEKDFHELVEEHEEENKGWKRFGYGAGAAFAVAAAIAIGLVLNSGLKDRVTRVEQSEDPCSRNLHGETCQARTCERLSDVGYKLSERCLELLKKHHEGKLPEGPGADGQRFKGVVPDSGNNSPSGKPGGPSRPPPARTQPQPTQPAPQPTPAPPPRRCLINPNLPICITLNLNQ